jgi:hypothetical protein
MPQGSKLDENGNVIWPYDICCEFDCNIEHAARYGVNCGGDFTKPPCMFLGEHKELNQPGEDNGNKRGLPTDG